MFLAAYAGIFMQPWVEVREREREGSWWEEREKERERKDRREREGEREKEKEGEGEKEREGGRKREGERVSMKNDGRATLAAIFLPVKINWALTEPP